MKRLILSLGMVFTAACAGASSEDNSAAAPQSETGAINEQLARAEPEAGRASLSGFSSFGLCGELATSIGQQEQNGVELPGVISCFPGFGVDGFTFWGDVSAGYISAMAEPPTALANGRKVGAMDVEQVGEPARALFDALTGPTVTTELVNGQPSKVSQNGRIRCSLLPTGDGRCTFKTMVSFWSGRDRRAKE